APLALRAERLRGRGRADRRRNPAQRMARGAAEASVFVAGAAQAFCGLRPARLDAPVPLEEHPGAEQPLHPAPRHRPDLLEPRPALADHDALLALALEHDRRLHAHQPARADVALRLVELLHQHRGAVRYFLLELAQQLLADQLAAEVALRRVGPLL